MINQLTLVGRLTKDPEIRITSEGVPITHITLAVSRHFKNQQGQIEADFVQCTLWRKTAENTANYCRKGSVVGITGRIQTRHYDNSEGRRVYVTEVIAESVQFLSRRQSENVPAERSERTEPAQPAELAQTAQSAQPVTRAEPTTIPLPF
jgi:single-strand DNA-binding protein